MGSLADGNLTSPNYHYVLVIRWNNIYRAGQRTAYPGCMIAVRQH